MKVVFVGAGNLATRLSIEMHRVGMTIGQVYSLTEESAHLLASKLNAPWTTDIVEIIDDADLYIFSVKDAVLETVLAQMKPNGGLWVHTAGSIPMDIFSSYTSRYGVFYPLQTFSKGRVVSFDKIPVFLETAKEEDQAVLLTVANALTDTVLFLSSEKRKQIHLAAVFACNFANHMYVIAEKILEEQEIPYKMLLPLIEETASKLQDLSPLLAQTGPAVRYDENVIEMQSDLLTNERYRELYRLISQSIHIETGNE
ncbi:Rossmann-like and DUF2520 domain-containing protein [Parabacteroides sp. PF5-6]|uniref:Rossmann-like and DUF2520 domain-containing protein n=1 Tax=Parabacteroides sp. PF5-6 TaxID=1742403 RepID=UPI00240530C3|nr:Rossmann-like and DUF2520 domain-containing protein [Parabacteroides sp. PF5-6]MDF9831219.1 putative short-subunit dehydrogenase-like oxidoreductase (DUF2520 family) [Parabacteroides sp. PF5-6]